MSRQIDMERVNSNCICSLEPLRSSSALSDVNRKVRYPQGPINSSGPQETHNP